MSGPLRKLIGPAKSRLQRYNEAANDLLENKILKEPELDEIENEMEDYINRLSSNIAMLERCNKDWSTLLKETKGDAKVTEEREYARMAEGDEGFIEIMLVANDVLSRLKAKVTLISRKREQAIRMRPLTSSAQEQLQPIVEQAAVQATRAAIQESLSLSLSRTQSDVVDTSIRLPKMHLPNFDGNLLKWPEFWDVFESSVDKQNISDVAKFSYLKGALRGTAFMAISGISLTNENYSVAVAILKEKFGKKDSIIEMLYTKLHHLSVSSTKFNDIKYTYDTVERLLRQLESQGEQVDQQKMLVHQILSKFPLNVVLRLEECKKVGDVWTMELLRKLLKQYIEVQESAQRHVTNARGHNQEFRQHRQNDQQFTNRHNAENRQTPDASLPLMETLATNVRKGRGSCIFCKGEHFSDECDQYKDLSDRKKKLSSQGRCFLCFKIGHTVRDCITSQRKGCFYCGGQRHHNRAICPVKFGNRSNQQEGENDKAASEDKKTSEENPPSSNVELSNSTNVQSLMATGERVLLQTATVVVQSSDGLKSATIKVLFDSASHRTFMTDKLAKRLQLSSQYREALSVSTFAARRPQDVDTYVVQFSLITKNGTSLPLQANVINQITGPIYRGPLQSSDLDFLLSIPTEKMADSIPKNLELGTVDLLIGSDYFWTIVGTDKMILPSGLFLVSSKIGYILTGSYLDPTSS